MRRLQKSAPILPARVIEARAFGSVLRGIKNPHDLDIVFLYETSDRQRAEWDWFASVFGTVNFIKEPERRQKADRSRLLLRSTLQKYRNRCPILSEALQQAKVRRLAKRIQLNLQWASCYSWTDYFIGPLGNGITAPQVGDVLRKIIVDGLNRRGLQVHFAQLKSSSETIEGLNLVRNFRKVWDLNTPPEIVPERFRMTEPELLAHLKAEFAFFSEQYASEIMEVRKRADVVNLDARNKGLKLDLLALPEGIETLVEPSIPQLQEQCERAREKLRFIRRTFPVFIGFLARALEFPSTKDEISLTRNTLQCATTELTEGEIRELLKKLGLPENEFIIFTAYGGKAIIHETSKEIRDMVTNQNTRWQSAHDIGLKLKSLLPFDKRFCRTNVYLHETGKAKVADASVGWIPQFGDYFNLHITYECPTTKSLKLKKTLRGSAWKVSKHSWQPTYIEIERNVRLCLNHSLQRMKEELGEAIAPFSLKT